MKIFALPVAINWIYVVAGVFSLMSIISLLVQLRRHTCLFGHKKKRFIAMDLHGSKNDQGKTIPLCYCWSTARDTLGNTLPSHEHRFLMRWFCEECKRMGEHCWDQTGEWKLEHGKIVPDEKRWAQRL